MLLSPSIIGPNWVTQFPPVSCASSDSDFIEERSNMPRRSWHGASRMLWLSIPRRGKKV